MSEHATMGKIEVSPKASATIAANGVLRCYGIVGMAPVNLGDGIAEILQVDNLHRGVKVQVVHGRIVIDLFVVLEYGVPIAAVAQNIMSGVKFSVEKAVGVPIASVNVHVQGLHVSDEEKKDRRKSHPFKRTQVARSNKDVQDGRVSSGGKTLER